MRHAFCRRQIENRHILAKQDRSALAMKAHTIAIVTGPDFSRIF